MTPTLASQRHLAGILEGYLRGETWCTDKILEGHVYRSHSIDELREVLNSPMFSYLHTINSDRLHKIKAKFLGET